MGAVDSVFGFGGLLSGVNFGFIEFNYDKRCESLSALIYYIHILEDYIHDNYENSLRNGRKIPFASSSKLERTLISEVIEHSRVLFVHKDQKHADFDRMEQELKGLNSRTVQYIGVDGSVAEEDYDHFHACVVEMKEILHNRLRNLLMKESFWNNVFGTVSQ